MPEWNVGAAVGFACSWRWIESVNAHACMYVCVWLLFSFLSVHMHVRVVYGWLQLLVAPLLCCRVFGWDGLA